MRQFIVVAAMALMGIQVWTTAEAAEPIGGKYIMAGQMVRPAGNDYRGECRLEPIQEYFDVQCVSGPDQYSDKAYLMGDVLSLYLGEYLIVYRVQTDGSLSGNWVHINSDAVGTETLTPVGP